MSPILVVGLVVATAAMAGIAAALRRRGGRTVSIRRDAPTTTRSLPTGGLGERIRGVFRGGVDGETWRMLEETLLAADVGVAATTALVDAVRARGVTDGAEALRALRSEMMAVFGSTDRSLALDGSPVVVVVVGVNGSGKTTTIAKLAARLQRQGHRVILGAADTFRAAASDQLRTWGERLGIDVISGSPGADPASVAHDALAAARARGATVLIVDTAGRLHDKRNLMDELTKIVRVLGRDGTPPHEVLLVIDGTTGQNGLAQARAFATAAAVTGVALSKLDGTARGGIAIAIERELGVPIKLVGVGEGLADLRDFMAGEFVDSLLEDR